MASSEGVLRNKNGYCQHPIVAHVSLAIVCAHIHFHHVLSGSVQLFVQHQIGVRSVHGHLTQAEQGLVVALHNGEVVLLATSAGRELDAKQLGGRFEARRNGHIMVGGAEWLPLAHVVHIAVGGGLLAAASAADVGGHLSVAELVGACQLSVECV